MVEGDNKTGTLEINKFAESVWIQPLSPLLTTSDINIPGTPGITSVSPTGATANVTATTRGVNLEYDTASAGWTGGGFSYDDFSTQYVETYDFSGINNIVVGLKGTPSEVYMEIVDSVGNKASLELVGISSTKENIWSMDMSLFVIQGVDLTKVCFMYFIVKGDNKSGTLEINRLAPSTIPPTPEIAASTTLAVSDINIPGSPRETPISDNDAVATVAFTPRGATLTYDTNTTGWAGAGFTYDDFTTTGIETYNISSLTDLILGLKGTPTQVKLEVIDNLDKKATVILTGISSTTENVWAIPVTTLASQGIDLSNIRIMYLIVEGDNVSGTLEINRLASSSIIGPSTTYTLENINLPSGGLYYPNVVAVPDNGVTSQAEVAAHGMTFEYNTNIAIDSVANYTTPTNIALSMTEWLLIAKGDLQVPGVLQDDALDTLSKSINTIYNIPDTQKWNGFYYIYNFSTNTYGDVISQADNGNLAAALAAITGALQGETTGNPTKQDIVDKAKAILDGMDWTKFVNSTTNKMYTALDINKSTGIGIPQGFPYGTPYYVDNVFDEFRLGIIFGIVQDNVDQTAWTNMSKNITTCTIDNGVNLTTLKSGNGAMFQAFLPSIFFKESDWSKNADGSLNGFGVALKNFAIIQDYAARTNGFSGLFSAAMNPAVDGQYREFGVPDLAVYPAPRSACAPYASALAYLADPSLAMTWLNSLYAIGVDTPYGFRDSITADGVMANRMLALDDGMIVLALQGSTVGNYVENYFNSIGKLQIVKDLYKNTLTLSDQTGAATPLTSAQETLRDSIAVEHFNAFKNIADAQTGWVYDHFNIHSGWAGAGFSYDNGADLNALGQNIIIGITGDSSRIKFEVVDNNGNKAFVYLDGISSTQENIYAIPLSSLQGVDLSSIKTMYFVIEGENKTGTIEVSRYANPMLIESSLSLTAKDINIPGQGVGYPAIQGIASTTSVINAESTDRGIKITYDTQSGGWIGGGFSYTASASGAVNISSYTQLVFSLKGSSDINGRIKFEIKDSSDRSAYVYLDGIDLNTEKVWAIPTASLGGVDLSSIKYMYFIVEGNDRAGTLYVNRVKDSQWILPITTPPDPTPNLPTTDRNIFAVASSPATAAITNSSASQFTLSYNTSTAGWAGASFGYNPTINMMSGFDRLVFRMSGSASRIKFEIKDGIGGKYSLYLDGITDFSQTWSIQKSLINGIDWTSIKEFNFIVEGTNQSGTLDVTANP